MKRLSLGAKVIAANVVLLLLIAAAISITVLFNGSHLKLDSRINELSDLTARDLPKLMVNAKEIQIRVIQVQQYLTDVSATRGLDGLDDGFKEAAKNAEEFHALVGETGDLARRLALAKVTKALDEVDQAFGPYYENGQKMARLYVAEGPAAGNKLMGDFDAVSDKLGESVQELVTVASRISADGQQEIDQRTDEAVAQLRFINAVLLGLGGFAVAVGVGIFLFVRWQVTRPLNSVIGSMLALADGKTDRKPPYLGRTDEIGRMAQAIEVFRVNAIRIEENDKEFAELRAGAEEQRRKALREMCEMLEADLDSAVGEVLTMSNDAALRGGEPRPTPAPIAAEAVRWRRRRSRRAATSRRCRRRPRSCRSPAGKSPRARRRREIRQQRRRRGEAGVRDRGRAQRGGIADRLGGLPSPRSRRRPTCWR